MARLMARLIARLIARLMARLVARVYQAINNKTDGFLDDVLVVSCSTFVWGFFYEFASFATRTPRAAYVRLQSIRPEATLIDSTVTKPACLYPTALG